MSLIALTGATGFVGQAAIEEALAGGHMVRALTRRPQLDRAGVEWVAGDLADAAALARLCDGADAVLHIAGAVNVPTRADFAAANIAGTEAVVDAAVDAGVRRFVHVSSLSAREPDLSDYCWSKAGGEQAVMRSDLDWVVVRPPGVYGPRDTEVLEMFRMARRGWVLLPPAGRSSWIYVADLARLLVALADGGPRGVIWEPDDGHPADHELMARALGRAVGRKRVTVVHAPRALLKAAARIDRLVRGDRAKLTPDRAGYMSHPDWTVSPDRRPDPSFWQARIGPEEGFAETARWYRQAGWLGD